MHSISNSKLQNMVRIAKQEMKNSRYISITLNYAEKDDSYFLTFNSRLKANGRTPYVKDDDVYDDFHRFYDSLEEQFENIGYPITRVATSHNHGKVDGVMFYELFLFV